MIDKTIIERLSKILSKEHIVWGVGGSYLLQLHHLYSNPNDLDIWVQPSDISKVKALFEEYEKIETDIYLPEKYHLKIKFCNVLVDFVACFMTKPNQNEFEFHILPQNIKYIEINNGCKIPCTYLEDWYIVYKLLKREDKARIIEEVFLNRRINMSEKALSFSIQNKNNRIPKKIIKEACGLIESTMQLSLFDSNFAIEVNNPDEKDIDSIKTNT